MPGLSANHLFTIDSKSWILSHSKTLICHIGFYPRPNRLRFKLGHCRAQKSSSRFSYPPCLARDDCLFVRRLMKVHHGLATYRGGASDVNQGCAMWLPTFLQRGIHFFGERTEVLAFNNFVLFDRVHLPIIGKRAAVVEEKAALLSQSAVTLRRVAISALLTNYQSSIPSDPS